VQHSLIWLFFIAAVTAGMVGFIVFYWTQYRVTQQLKVSHNDELNAQTGRLNKQINEQNREAKELRAALDQLPDAVISLNAQLEVLWYNKRAYQWFGELKIGQSILNWLRQPEFAQWLKSSQTEPDTAPLQLDWPSSIKQLLELQISKNGENDFLLIVSDITQRENLDRMRRDFVANVSHEIRTPLTVVHGFAEAMLDQEFDRPTQQNYLNLIIRQSHTLRGLVDDLLTLSTLENTQAPPEHEAVSLLQLLEQQLSDAKVLSDNKHQIKLVSSEPLVIYAAGSELETAIRNLIGNALRYTPEGGSISAGLTTDENEVQIFVSDTGIGIGAEHIDRLSERFYRVDKARSRDNGGTGLGLAIVKRIALRHGGRLAVTSQLGCGSTFSLVLPAYRLLPVTKP
jgi:two-component system, OmpR family, phosphate regulon sensor histidine kinase PhoR